MTTCLKRTFFLYTFPQSFYSCVGGSEDLHMRQRLTKVFLIPLSLVCIHLVCLLGFEERDRGWPIAGSVKGSVTCRFCPRETSYGRSFGDPPHPHPLRNVTHFFRLFILQALRLSVEYKNQDLILSIHIYLKCKYTHKNAGFCIL